MLFLFLALYIVAAKTSLNIHSAYCENFMVLSLSFRVNGSQLNIEDTSQAPVLRHKDVTFTAEKLQYFLSAECPVLGVHNVARVRRGVLPYFEVDFIGQTDLGKFCKALEGK